MHRINQQSHCIARQILETEARDIHSNQILPVDLYFELAQASDDRFCAGQYQQTIHWTEPTFTQAYVDGEAYEPETLRYVFGPAFLDRARELVLDFLENEAAAERDDREELAGSFNVDF